ncbi:MAG: two-component regulator propeller domain-containing protein [Bacteroidota bacterium]|nr:two-component regulator propeller domain-containing protein [Bacteroidota bacterium]
MKIWSFIFLFIFCCQFFFPQQLNHGVESFSDEQGLPQNSIYAIHQDKKGFLWVGTGDGLAQFDGYFFHSYRHSPLFSQSLSNNFIRCIAEDAEGEIWLGLNNGLDILSPSTGSFYSLTSSLTESIRQTGIWSSSLCFDGIKTMWYISNRDLFAIDVRTKNIRRYTESVTTRRGLEGNPKRMFVDLNNQLCVFTENSFYQYNAESDSFTKRPLKNFTGYSSVKKAYQATNGFVWILTENNGVFIADVGYGSILGHALNNISMSDLYGDKNGGILVSTNTGTIYLFSNDGTTHTQLFDNHGNGESPFTINKIFCDQSGNIWIGTDGDGIKKYSPHTNKFNTFSHEPHSSNSLSGNFIKSIYEDHIGHLWFGGVNSNISDYDQVSKTFRHFFLQGDNAVITNIMEDDRQKIWFTTAQNLYRFDPADEKITTINSLHIPNPRYTTLLQKNHNILWCGTLNGVYEYDFNKGKVLRNEVLRSTAYPFLDNETISLYRSLDKSVWIGTGDGFAFITPNDSISKFATKRIDSLLISPLHINSFHEQNDSSMWIGTNNGLYHFNRTTMRFSPFGIVEGIPNNIVYGILEDSHRNLWISTNKGLSKFSLDSHRFRNYTPDDGLQSSEFNSGAYWKTRSGLMVFGGIKGVNIFHPDLIHDNPVIPIIVFTKIQFNDSTLTLSNGSSTTKSISMNYLQNALTVEFSALEFSNSHKNIFAYRLEGFDNGWNYIDTKRIARYTNLNPGEYIFRVRGTNNDGIWSTADATLSIDIVIPFWMSMWFRIIGILAVIVIIVGSIRMYELGKTRRLIEVLEHQQALELERSRISRDMHDEVGSSLTQIAVLSELAKRGDSQVHLEKISTTSRELIDNISQIIWAINPKNDKLENMTAYLREYISETFEMTNILCIISFPDELPTQSLTAEYRRNIFLTIKESVNNIVKYSLASEVHALLNIAGNELSFSISDNGIGFNTVATSRFGIGLLNMKKRIEEIGGVFTINSAVGEGTTITFRVPITTFV